MKIVNRRAFVGAMGAAAAGSLLAGCAPKNTGTPLPDTGLYTADPDAWQPTAKSAEPAPLLSEPRPMMFSDEEIEQILNNKAVVTTDWVNSDGTKVSPAQQMVRNTINRNGIGVGSMCTRDHHLDLWPYLFSEEEADIYNKLPMYAEFTIPEAAEATGYSEDECKRLLNAVSDRGLLRRTYENGEPVYMTFGSEYGYYESYVQHFDEEYLTLKDLNQSEDLGLAFLDSGSSMYRTLPVDLSVCIDGEYTKYDDWHDILERNDRFGVSPCMCRVSTLIREGKAKTTKEAMELFNETMRDCGHPMDTCIVTGKEAEYLIDIDAAREITREEAYDILNNSVKKGLIIETVYTKAAENICSCHADCCLNVGAVRTLNGGPAMTEYSNFDLMHQKDYCVKCGACEKRCPMFAIHMDDEGYPTVDDACVRCGQCALVCPQGVRGLKLKPEDQQCDIPDTLADDYRAKAKKRIGKGYCFDITSQADHMKTLAAIAEQMAK